MALLDAETAKLKSSVIPGETVFRLYDTYGFPADLTADVARERGLSIDQAGFDAAMEAQRAARERRASLARICAIRSSCPGKTEFSGYDRLADVARVTSLIFDGAIGRCAAAAARKARSCWTTRRSMLRAADRSAIPASCWAPTARFTVRDTQKIGASFAHVGVLENGELRVGDVVDAQVDQERRKAIALNHSATHLLHAALEESAGKACRAKGLAGRRRSVAFRLFAHSGTDAGRIASSRRSLVNSAIRENEPAETRVMALDEAVAAGAMSLFGEKYENDVRVLSIGDFSMELCGGTHVERAGDIGLFKITGESGVAAGIRRVEAVTGQAAYEWVVHTDQVLRDIAAMLRGSREDVDEKVRELVERSRRLEKEVQQLKSKLASGHGGDLSDSGKGCGRH